MPQIPPSSRSFAARRVIGVVSLVLVGSILFSIIATDSIATDCINYQEFLHWEAFLGDMRMTDMRIVGDYAYVAHDRYGITILDISDLASPIIIGSLDLPGYSRSIDVQGQYAYIVNGDVVIVDISDPTDPVEVNTYEGLPGTAGQIVVDGGYAYVSEQSFALRVLDVSDPTDPFLAGWVSLAGDGNAIALVDHYVYFCRNGSIYIIDVSIPTVPVIIDELVTPGHAYNLWVDGSLVYVAGGSAGLLVYDVTDPTSPILIGNETTPEYAHRVAAFGNRTYVADDTARLLWIYDTSTPAVPAPLAAINGAGTLYGMRQAGSQLVYLDYLHGLGVVDVSNPTNTESIGNTHFLDGISSVVVRDEIGYVANQDVGLSIIDVSNPSKPYLIGGTDTPGRAHDVALQGDYAFIADGDRGLRVADISDPQNPYLIVGNNLPGDITAAAIRGSYLYLTQSQWGIRTFDISDPTDPIPVGAAWLPELYRARLEGDYIFAAQRLDGLAVLDLEADPADPPTIAVLDLPGYEYRLEVEGTRAYVMAAPGDYEDLILHIVNISNPHLPWLIRSMQGPIRDDSDIAVSERILYVTDSGLGLLIFDTDDETTELPVGMGPPTDALRGLSLTGGYLFGATWEDDLHLMPLHCSPLSDAITDAPAGPRFLEPPHPNPAHGRVSIDFFLPARDEISLVLYDPAGRRLRTLLDRDLDPGPRSVEWNLRDDRGHLLPSGRYFVRLSGRNFSDQRRVLIMR